MKTMKNFIQKVFKGDPMIWGYVMLSYCVCNPFADRGCSVFLTESCKVYCIQYLSEVS